MNYYERHLGDYARDAGHLTILEHGAYTLLLDRYYTTEQAIPMDQAHRICRARTRDEKTAVDAVLAEFFTLTDGAYHQKRVDAEIERYRKSEPAREAKRENERERQRRTRERRQEIFDKLRSHGIVPAFDTPMSELQAALSRVESRVPKQAVTRDITPPVTLPVTLPVTRDITPNVTPVTCDVTATQTPDTSINPPIPPKGRRDAVSLKTWAAAVRAGGEKLIPENDAVFDYASAAGIPDDFMALAWHEFRHRYSQPGAKRYRDWRQVFRKAVRGNWLKLWYCDHAGAYALTTVGIQAKRAMESAEVAAA